jgi:hypothetical protein
LAFYITKNFEEFLLRVKEKWKCWKIGWKANLKYIADVEISKFSSSYPPKRESVSNAENSKT